ncbi:hypothetical protein [Cupriavidus sp. PET2-C1]
MRKILMPSSWMTALTALSALTALAARLASPFLHRIEPGTASMAPTKDLDLRNRDAHAPRTNREFADAAIRLSRTLW